MNHPLGVGSTSHIPVNNAHNFIVGGSAYTSLSYQPTGYEKMSTDFNELSTFMKLNTHTIQYLIIYIICSFVNLLYCITEPEKYEKDLHLCIIFQKLTDHAVNFGKD